MAAKLYAESMIDYILFYHTETPSKIAVSDTIGGKLSYSDLLVYASHIARVLIEEYGVGSKHAKVAIALQNTVNSVLALYGIWLANSIAVVIDPLSFEEDLIMQLSMSKPGIVVVEHRDASRICSVAAKLDVKCITTSTLVEKARRRVVWEGYTRPRAWSSAVIYFYAGIAGRTLEVIHTHSSITASATITSIHFKFTSEDKVFVTPPISHVLGLQISLLASHSVGAEAILLTKFGKLDPGKVLENIAKAKPSLITGAPQLYQILLDAGYRGHEELRFGISAGAALPLETRLKWEKTTGKPLLQLYGMTEAAPVSATLPEDNPENSIGRPMPGIEVKLASLEDPLKPAKDVGELLVRGPVVMKEYGDPTETSKAILPGGWLRTGDIIEIRNGHLYFRGVKKRMLKYKGYPIFPRDLELVLEKHPAVAKALVEGEPIGSQGQVPIAKVWLKKGARVSPKELIEWVNSKVAPYKRIRRIEIVGEM